MSEIYVYWLNILCQLKLTEVSVTVSSVHNLKLILITVIFLRLSGVVVNVLAFRPRGPGFASRPYHYVTGLGSNLGQVIYSHCLPSLLRSKKLGYKREYLDWTDLTAQLTECVRLS